MADGLTNVFIPQLDYYRETDDLDHRKNIFIFHSNTAGGKSNEETYVHFKKVKKNSQANGNIVSSL